MLTLYDTLQVAPGATVDVIQSAYRALARTYHPDINPTAEAARRMQQINAAYAVLIDPELRAQYDARRSRQERIRRGERRGVRRAPAASQAPPPSQPVNPAAGAIPSPEPTVLILKACPRIGFRDDQSNHFLKPTQLHACFASGRPDDVSVRDQRLYCLRSEFMHCPRWLAAGPKPPPMKGQAAKGPSGGEPARASTERPQPRVASQTARARGDDLLVHTGAFRWAAQAGAVRGWVLPVMLMAALLLAVVLTLVVVLALVADVLDLDPRNRPAWLTPPVWSRPLAQESPIIRAAHPAVESSSSVVPWACAFWRSGPGPFC